MIAVDATRLGAVATWSPAYGSLSAATIGTLLHPSGYAPPINVTASSIAVDVTTAGLNKLMEMTLGVDLVPFDGSAPLTIQLGELANGTATLTVPVPCAAGCRIAGFGFDQGRISTYRFTSTIRAVRADGKQVIGSTAGSDWIGGNGSSVAAGAAGPTISLNSPNSNATHVCVTPAPNPLPIVTTSQLPKSVSISMLDGTSLPVAALRSCRACHDSVATGCLGRSPVRQC